MSKYLTKFNTTAAYNAAQGKLDLPNVSLITETNGLYYEPKSIKPIETRMVAVFDVDYNSYVKVTNDATLFSEIEIDNIVQPKVTNEYELNAGEHTVKYTFIEGVLNIQANSFNGLNNLVSITIPDSIINIDNEAFKGCIKLTEVVLGNSIQDIKSRVFEDCINLISINLPNSVTNIGEAVFRHCTSLTSITIPDNVHNIYSHLLAGCSSLKSITLGNNIENINSGVFENCTELSEITCTRTSAPNLSGGVFNNVAPNGKLYVPTGSMNSYNNYWMYGNGNLANHGWVLIEQ